MNSRLKIIRRNTIRRVDVGGVRGNSHGARCDDVMNVNVAVPGAVTGAAGATQLPWGIVPEQVIVTGPVKPPRAPIVTVTLAAAPAVVEAVEGRLRLKSKPVPLKATVCGLPVALSAIERVPVRGLFEVAVGTKVTLIVQVAFTAIVAPLHVLVCAKSLETVIA